MFVEDEDIKSYITDGFKNGKIDMSVFSDIEKIGLIKDLVTMKEEINKSKDSYKEMLKTAQERLVAFYYSILLFLFLLHLKFQHIFFHLLLMNLNFL